MSEQANVQNFNELSIGLAGRDERARLTLLVRNYLELPRASRLQCYCIPNLPYISSQSVGNACHTSLNGLQTKHHYCFYDSKI